MNKAMPTVTILFDNGKINAKWRFVSFVELPFFCCENRSRIVAIFPIVLIQNVIESILNIGGDSSTVVLS